MGGYRLRGVSVVGGPPADLLLRDGVVAEIAPAGAPGSAAGSGTVDAAGAETDAAGAETVDATGLVALPGLVDLHTHLREPGREDAETVATGSQAAALGGYTAVCAMPNTDPVADTAGVVEQVLRLGRQAGLVDVQPVGAVTVGLRGEQLAELAAMAGSAARVRMFSDDGRCVADARMMRRALEYVKALDAVVAQHAEEPRLTEGAQLHEGEVATRLGLAGWPAVAEEAVIARDVLLAAHVGSRLHVCHVSTAGSVEILRQAKDRGVRVTAEVTPHHLLLTDERAASYDPVFKVNPPLRPAADTEALRRAVADGVIDAIATDHAPHTVEDKECEWAYARPGMLGLQTALSVALAVFGEGTGGRSRSTERSEPGGAGQTAPWQLLAERMSRAPARIAGLADHGRDLVVGAPANLTLVDPAARWTVEPAELASRSRNTPYAGTTLPGRVVATFLRGVPTVLDGKLVGDGIAARDRIAARDEGAVRP